MLGVVRAAALFYPRTPGSKEPRRESGGSKRSSFFRMFYFRVGFRTVLLKPESYRHHQATCCVFIIISKLAVSTYPACLQKNDMEAHALSAKGACSSFHPDTPHTDTLDILPEITLGGHNQSFCV